MRFVRLFHSRFNMANKFLARKIKWRGDSMGLLPREQAGGRKHHRANIVCACKTLMWDIIQQKRIPASLSSVDATTCYDRILYLVTLLCTLKWGIAFNAMICMLHCLFMMETSVKMAHGISSKKYGTLHDHLPHHGMGQGNGGGPPIYDTAVSYTHLTLPTTPYV